LFVFDHSFLVAIGVLSLIMVAFDSLSRFRLKEASPASAFAYKILGFFVLLSILLIPLFTNAFFLKQFSLTSWLLALIFALVAVGTDLDAVMVMLSSYAGARVKRVIGLLQTEAVLSTALVVVVPFIIIDIVRNIGLGQSALTAQVSALLLQIIIGIGAGVVIGLIVLKTMQKFYSHHVSSIGLITSILLAYILAENLKGNGVLAVATMGFLFGSFYVQEKPKLQEFSYMLSNALEIFVFVLLGMMLKIPLTKEFILGSLFLFVLLVLARLAAVFAVLRESEYALREKFFISLNMPKGIAVAVIIFVLALLGESSLDALLSLMFAFMVYSLILSSVVNKFSKKFIKSR
jgi:NhaP-type Na+/H+ or K+/H+ antiporter